MLDNTSFDSVLSSMSERSVPLGFTPRRASASDARAVVFARASHARASVVGRVVEAIPFARVVRERPRVDLVSRA